MRWVVLLLAIAVILPTVCLLWFMTQAVKNERLAVQQRFIDVYESKLDKALEQFNRDLGAHLSTNATEKILREKPFPDAFRPILKKYHQVKGWVEPRFCY